MELHRNAPASLPNSLAWLVAVTLVVLSFRATAAAPWSDTSSPSVSAAVARYLQAVAVSEREAALDALEGLGASNPEAWNQLGLLARTKDPVRGAASEKWFAKAATAKNLNGLMNLIASHINADQIATSCEVAKQATQWPDGTGAPAIGYLGECYRLGRHGAKDVVKAKRLLMESCRWGWDPACNSALELQHADRTPSGTQAYLDFLEKLAAADHPRAQFHLAEELSESPREADQKRSITLLEKASTAQYGPACVGLSIVLWGKGELGELPKIDRLLECGGKDDKVAPFASIVRGMFAAFAGDDTAGRGWIQHAFDGGMKQAGAFAVALSYEPPAGSEKTYCEPLCDWIEAIKLVNRLRLAELTERQVQQEIAAEAARRAEQEAAEVIRHQAEREAAAAASALAQMASHEATQNAIARRERRRRFWQGVLTVSLALATGYVQAHAQAYSNAPAPRAAYQHPALYAGRPIYHPTQQQGGLIKTCYIATAQGTQAITVNSVQPCPVSQHSLGQPLRRSGTGFLVGESVSGLIKICTYRGVAGTSAVNVAASSVCPRAHDY